MRKTHLEGQVCFETYTTIKSIIHKLYILSFYLVLKNRVYILYVAFMTHVTSYSQDVDDCCMETGQQT